MRYFIVKKMQYLYFNFYHRHRTIIIAIISIDTSINVIIIATKMGIINILQSLEILSIQNVFG